MPAIPEITVNTTTGGTVAIPASNTRVELLLRCRGGRVYLGFNENASAPDGIWLNDGDGVVIAEPLCQADVYMVTLSGTAYVGAETVN